MKGFDIVASSLKDGAEVGVDGLFVGLVVVLFDIPYVVGDPVECGNSARVPIMTPVFHIV